MFSIHATKPKYGKGYLDPCIYDFDKYFILNEDHVVTGEIKAAKYMIERLHLNCNFLIKIREERDGLFSAIDICELIISELENIIQRGNSKHNIVYLENLKSKMISFLSDKKVELKKRFTTPYEHEDLRQNI